MKGCLCLAMLSAAVMAAAPAGESIERALAMEREGKALEARSLLLETVGANPADPDALLARAEFLDRHADPGRLEAYQKAVRAFENSPDSEKRRRAARRLAVLALAEGDRAQAARAIEAYRAAGGADLQDPPAGDANLEEGYGYAEIPGIFNSFLRMAALSTDLEPGQMLPALARNLVTGGYRTVRGGESLEETEYLKLVKQYLTQARELRQFAGDNDSLDVPACESLETAQLLKILGYRLRGECGPEAVLETVNPSRAFLSIDAAFPLAELEDAFRRETSFHQPYGVTRLPVLFGEDYWMENASKKADGGAFIDVFLSDPSLARLYVAMEKLHRPTAIALREKVPAERLKNYANVLDFFGESFEIRDGKAVFPGGDDAGRVWAKLTGVAPDKGAEFYQALIESDDGWLAAYFDALARSNGPSLAYFTQPARMERFYAALRGRITSPGPARPIFRATSELLLLTSRLHFGADGQPHIPGNIEVWRDLFTKHPHGKYDGKLTKSAQGWKEADDVIEAMYALCRKVVENEPLRIFLAVTNLDRARTQRLGPSAVERLILAYPKYGLQFSVLNEAPGLPEETLTAYFDTVERVGNKGNQQRRSNAIGTFQALTSLWQILVRQGHIGPEKADESLRKIIEPFADLRDDELLFDAGRQGVLALLSAAGAPPDADQHQKMVELLAGNPAPGEEGVHRQIAGRITVFFNQQRLVPLKTLFDLADHLERVSRGESFNVAMANRLAASISEVRLPRSDLSTPEANSMGGGSWIDAHIRHQRDLNLRRSVDKAQGDPKALLEIRGDIAPILRDSLVGLVYAYYAPPGAELIRANPLFVRSHDFLGPEGARSWQAARLHGSGWPSSAGGRIVGSLASIAYGLNDAEQNFLIPTERQALIWQDLAPQVLLGSTVPRWWGVHPAELRFVALHLSMGESLAGQAALDPGLRREVLAALRNRIKPGRLWRIEFHLEQGDTARALRDLTPAELYGLAVEFLRSSPDRAREIGAPFAGEIQGLQAADSRRFDRRRIAGVFGVPHPELAHSYRPDMLELPLFPTMMGYSSRILAESWESTNLYWAALANQAHLAPAELNLRAPEWTQRTLERIFATHLDDWPALLRSMRIVGDRYRTQLRAQMEQTLQASLQ